MKISKPDINKEKWKTLIGYSVLLTLLLTAIHKNQDLFQEVLQYMRHIPLHFLFMALLAAILYQILDGYILYLFSRRYCASLSVGNGIHAVLCGSFFRVATFGSGMGITKVYYLTHDGLPVGNSMGACLLQTIFFRAAVWVLGVLSLLLFPSVRSAMHPYRYAVTVGLFLSMALLFFLVTISFSRKFTAFLFRYAYRISKNHAFWTESLNKLQEQVSLLQTEAEAAYREKSFALHLLLLSIVQQLVLYLIPYFGSGDTSLSMIQMSAMTAVGYMLAGIIPMPSGFGSQEYVFSILFSKLTSASATASAIIIFRFMVTFLPFFIGAFPVFFHKSSHRAAQNE